MEGFIGAVFATVFFVYFILCAVTVPTWFLNDYYAERECAQKHKVFACERGEWKPVEATR